ncbi:MAG TPA: Mur ligase family protein [Chitinophagaceae bacterium]|nr:Mur ligase family protein [Chitinophagaceae bacterium]
MNYHQTLDYLFAKLPMFTRVGAAAYKADLNNTIQLCKALDNPHTKFKSIHIAGTNGKGSVSHMLASVFQSAGYKTGLYTSPHLIDFKERIKINRDEIEESWVIEFVEKIIPIIEEIQPSFFEVTVAMAFSYFAEKDIDIAIIEVGLGGLLDSTNIITPELSIITNISFDHTNLLGSTLHEIAFQKSGIIKHKIPVVVGQSQNEIDTVFIEKATQCESEIFFADQSYSLISHQLNHGFQIISLENNLTQERFQIELDLVGQYQLKNCTTVIKSLDVLKQAGWNIQLKDILYGLKNVKLQTGLKGRFDILLKSPILIADVAHNEAGLTEVFNQINAMNFKQLHIILGFVKDKDVETALKIFPQSAKYYFTQADIPRALPYYELKELANTFSLNGDSYPTVNQALQSAFEFAEHDDMILVTGSFFIMADIYSYVSNFKNELKS